MRVLLLAAVSVFAVATVAHAAGSNSVRGYIKRDGTYVAPSYRTNPNNTALDNYSTRGNLNPYTGQMGTRSPTPSYGSSYSSPVYRAPGYGSSYNPPLSSGSSFNQPRSSGSSYGY